MPFPRIKNDTVCHFQVIYECTSMIFNLIGSIKHFQYSFSIAKFIIQVTYNRSVHGERDVTSPMLDGQIGDETRVFISNSLNDRNQMLRMRRFFKAPLLSSGNCCSTISKLKNQRSSVSYSVFIFIILLRWRTSSFLSYLFPIQQYTRTK